MLDTLNPRAGDLAVFRAAKRLVDSHGREAPREALRHAAERSIAGDGESAAVYMHLANACRELLNTDRGDALLN